MVKFVLLNTPNWDSVLTSNGVSTDTAKPFFLLKEKDLFL